MPIARLARLARRVVAAVPLAALCGGAAWGVGITEFRLATGNSGPTGIVAGPDGALWFTEEGVSKIGRISTTGSITEYPTLHANGVPAGIAVGPDGALWFTELAVGVLGRITVDGAVSEYALPPGANPQGITAGPDGAIWFTDTAGGKIGRFTQDGFLTEYPLSGSPGPVAITTGPDGALWFTESASAANKIGRITTKGAITEYPVPTAKCQPFWIVAGPDGALWFTEQMAHQIGRIATDGTVTEFPVLDAGYGIAAGPDGNLWFTEPTSNKIASLATDGAVVVEVPLPTALAGPLGIAAGPDGNLWFAESSVAQIGRTTFPCVASATTLCLDDRPGDRRWQASVAFATAEAGGRSGDGQAIPLAGLGVAHGGLFWFFTAGNPELLLKVLDACALNQSFWVFSSAATNVGFTLVVTDTRTGRTRTYVNHDGTAAPPVQDTSAFACTGGDAAPTERGARAAAMGEPPWPGPQEAAVEAGASRPAAAAAATSTATPTPAAAAAAATAAPTPAAAGPATACASSPTAVCIAGRFLVTVRYRAGGGRAGPGQAIALESLGVDRGGLFWFFSQDNPEMLIKVLDGCALNQRFWVFYAAGTNVGFTVTVTDTQTGGVKTYVNVNGTAAPPQQDTAALPCS